MNASWFNGDFDLDHPSVEDKPEPDLEPEQGWEDFDQWALAVFWDACMRENVQPLLVEVEK